MWKRGKGENNVRKERSGERIKEEKTYGKKRETIGEMYEDVIIKKKKEKESNIKKKK